MTVRVGAGDLTIDMDGLVFVVRPQRYEDYIRAAAFLDGIEMSRTTNVGSTTALCLMLRIKSWKGFEDMEGKELACTDENKMRAFGEHPEIFTKLLKKVGLLEDREQKNGKTSQAGSQKRKKKSPRPAEPVKSLS